jgi:hypothetical protein
MKAINSVQWKKLLAGAQNITYLSPSKMDVGEEIMGRYLEKIVDSKFGGLRYRIEGKDGLIVLNGSGQLDYLMNLIEAGSLIRIVYRGKTRMQSGERKGTLAHQFEVYVADQSVGTP